MLIANELYGRGIGGLLSGVLLGVVDVLKYLAPHSLDVILLRCSMGVHVLFEDVSEKHHRTRSIEYQIETAACSCSVL